MASEARPRQHPLVNPEHATTLLRRIVEAWDEGGESDRAMVQLTDAINEARQLLGLERRSQRRSGGL